MSMSIPNQISFNSYEEAASEFANLLSLYEQQSPPEEEYNDICNQVDGGLSVYYKSLSKINQKYKTAVLQDTNQLITNSLQDEFDQTLQIQFDNLSRIIQDKMNSILVKYQPIFETSDQLRKNTKSDQIKSIAKSHIQDTINNSNIQTYQIKYQELFNQYILSPILQDVSEIIENSCYSLCVKLETHLNQQLFILYESIIKMTNELKSKNHAVKSNQSLNQLNEPKVTSNLKENHSHFKGNSIDSFKRFLDNEFGKDSIEPIQELDLKHSDQNTHSDNNYNNYNNNYNNNVNSNINEKPKYSKNTDLVNALSKMIASPPPNQSRPTQNAPPPVPPRKSIGNDEQSLDSKNSKVFETQSVKSIVPDEQQTSRKNSFSETVPQIPDKILPLVENENSDSTKNDSMDKNKTKKSGFKSFFGLGKNSKTNKVNKSGDIEQQGSMEYPIKDDQVNKHQSDHEYDSESHDHDIPHIQETPVPPTRKPPPPPSRERPVVVEHNQVIENENNNSQSYSQQEDEPNTNISSKTQYPNPYSMPQQSIPTSSNQDQSTIPRKPVPPPRKPSQDDSPMKNKNTNNQPVEENQSRKSVEILSDNVVQGYKSEPQTASEEERHPPPKPMKRLPPGAIALPGHGAISMGMRPSRSPNRPEETSNPSTEDNQSTQSAKRPPTVPVRNKPNNSEPSNQNEYNHEQKEERTESNTMSTDSHTHDSYSNAVPPHSHDSYSNGAPPIIKSDTHSYDPYTNINSAPLIIKKKDNSVSGDDKAIEKHALEWLNLHLESRDIHIDNLFTSLDDGLVLIYALEDATKDSVGKYNKKAMLPVHRVDNLAVALNFLARKGISMQFITPQGNHIII